MKKSEEYTDEEILQILKTFSGEILQSLEFYKIGQTDFFKSLSKQDQIVKMASFDHRLKQIEILEEYFTEAPDF